MSLFSKPGKNDGSVAFSPEEAIVAILFLAVTVDGNIAPEEEVLVIAASNRLNLLRGLGIDKFNGLVWKVREAIDASGREAVFAAGIKSLPAELAGTIYALATDVAYAEGDAKREEIDYLRQMQEALGISDDLATKVVEVMRLKNCG